MKADVWTNIFYAIAGVAIGVHGGFYVYVGLTMILLALGSAAFHGRWHPMGQAMDEMAMYVAFSAVAVSLIGASLLVSVVIAASLGIALAANWEEADSFVAVPALVIACLVILGVNHSWVYAGYLFVGYAVAVGIRQVGEMRHSPALHGLWHLFTAALMYATVMPIN